MQKDKMGWYGIIQMPALLQVTWLFIWRGNKIVLDLSRTLWNNQRTQVKTVHTGGFPGGAVVENLPANAGDMGSSPGLGRSHMPRSN